MDNQKVIEYVSGLIQKNFTKEQIAEQLLAVGWSDTDVDMIYSKALIALGVPANKENKARFTKKSATIEIALNFFSFILLGVIASSLGVLFYQIINKFFPDTLTISYRSNNSYSTSAIHYSISSLIIAFPIYYFVMRFWFKSFRDDEAKIESKLTKWLTYIVLLISSAVMIGDLIAVVYTFLQGELSVRFVLKALTLLTISGMILTFYYFERQKIQYKKAIPRSLFQKFFYGVSAVIIFGIALGFYAGGSPTTERKRGFDVQRARDLSELSSCINSYAKEYGRLPKTLNDLEISRFSYCAFKKDPQSKKPYIYRIVKQVNNSAGKKEATFELCANFSLPSNAQIDNRKGSFYYAYNDEKWYNHKAGLDCDKTTVVLGQDE